MKKAGNVVGGKAGLAGKTRHRHVLPGDCVLGMRVGKAVSLSQQSRTHYRLVFPPAKCEI